MRRAALAGLLCLAAHAAAVAAEQAPFPIPPDVARLSDTNLVQLGTTELQVQGFTTALALEPLLAFYAQALPAAGWTPSPLPWQRQHGEVAQRLEAVAAQDPQAAADPEIQRRLVSSREATQALQRQLHATKGREHILINILLGEPGSTAVFINRWQGEADWMRQAAAAPADDAACCSALKPLPDAGPLPFGMPRPAGATLFAKSSAGADSAELVLTSTEDPAAVESYYRKHLAYAGWSPRAGSPSAGHGLRSAAYGNARQLCIVSIGPAEGSGVPGARSLISISVMPRPPLLEEQPP